MDLLATLLGKPVTGDNKYSRGAVGLAVGSQSYPGAALLSVRGAVGVATGYIRLLSTDSAADLVLSTHPEVVLGDGPVDCWVVGSGFDESSESAERLRIVLAANKPTVIDASALDRVEFSRISASTVLTPHLGEAMRLASRIGVAKELNSPDLAMQLAISTGATCLLKGATTYIAHPKQGLSAIPDLSGWLATAGSGDVLGGVIGGLMARLTKKHPEFDATELIETLELAVKLHSRAADVAADEGGFGASAIAHCIGLAANEFRLTAGLG